MKWLRNLWERVMMLIERREVPETELFTPPARLIERVFLHCSASDNPAHDNIMVIKNWHLDRGFQDVGYHYFIKANGVIQIGRDIEITPAAQSGHNSHTIAICLHGLTKFTGEQFDTLRALCRAIARALPGVTFHGHKEVNPHKTCPVFNYQEVLSLDATGHLTT